VDLLTAWCEPSAYLAYSQVLAHREGEYVVRKQHYSGFFDNHLDSLLQPGCAQPGDIVGRAHGVWLSECTVREDLRRLGLSRQALSSAPDRA
jgi:hypothetical protein